MKKNTLIILIAILITSCNETNNTSGKDEKDVKIETSEEWIEVDNEEIISEYKNVMKEKDFSFERIGRCDDALEDTLHRRNQVYIEKEEISDSLIIVDFKFKDACCQVFLGDYSLLNNKIIFEFEQVNNEMCACICWYHHRLKLRNHNNLKEIEVKRK